MNKQEFENLPYMRKRSAILDMLISEAIIARDVKDVSIFTGMSAIIHHSEEQRDILTSIIRKHMLLLLKTDTSMMKDMPPILRQMTIDLIEKVLKEKGNLNEQTKEQTKEQTNS